MSVGPIPAPRLCEIDHIGRREISAVPIQPDGRLVKEFAENEPGISTLDISDAAPGTYILCAVSGT
ncbi:MAG: hypothetical protein U0X76_00080 [Bacteroidia bacterium]